MKYSSKILCKGLFVLRTAFNEKDGVRFQNIACVGVLEKYCWTPGGVRHDPQRFMGKPVTVPHFNRDTVEFASRERN